MRTILAVFVSMFVFVGPGWAQDVTAIKVPFNVSTSGNFAQVFVHYAANPQVIAGLGLAGCVAYLEDPACWSVFGPGIQASQTDNGGNINGIIRAPVGYDICRAKIDWGHASIDGGSTFNSSIVRNSTDNGMGYYMFLSQSAGRGTNITADVYLQFVKAGPGQEQKYNCEPTGENPWICTGKDCNAGSGQRILPGAHYP